MKKWFCILLMLCSLLLLLVGCKKDQPLPEGHFALIEEGKLIYQIVIPKKQSDMMEMAVTDMVTALKNEGVDATTTWMGDKTGATKEILVGKTANFSNKMLEGIDIERLGVNGFVIKVIGEQIVIAAPNDVALSGAVRYFSEQFLNVPQNRISMPQNYCYIASQGIFLSQLTLGGADIASYALSSDVGLEEPRGYLQALIAERCGVTLDRSGEHKILLTTAGAQAGRVTACFENGDLVIRAADLGAMKKAVVCFFYENIGRAVGTCALGADLSYVRDLNQTVFYSDFNVTQTEGVCCLDELITVHNYANEHGYKVFADYGAKYYISAVGKTVSVKTDVEWGNAEFIIDDSAVAPDKRGDWIFTIATDMREYDIDTVTSIDRNATNIGVTLPQKSIVTFYDGTTKQYIRYGANADSGATKRDTVIVHADGTIDSAAPLMWDFDRITRTVVLPIDTVHIAVGGGHFITVANRAPIECSYYARGINVMRSNTTVYNIKHSITGEGESGSPYSGFFNFANCAEVRAENCEMSGHRYYWDETAKVYYGTYDLGLGNAVSVSFKNCTQLNSIHDEAFWGVMGANYCKNITYDACSLSRFDAHKGVANATIKNSIVGRWGASITGYGKLLIQNSVFYADFMIGLREDYGSTWEGNIEIVDSAIVPTTNKTVVTVITGHNNGLHDFGYDCYMPENVTIDGLTVYSTKAKVYVFGNLNRDCTSSSYAPTYPFYVAKNVYVKRLRSLASTPEVVVSSNEVLFAPTKLYKE